MAGPISCSSCKTVLPDSARFCHHCGTPVSMGGTLPTGESTTYPQPSAKAQRRLLPVGTRITEHYVLGHKLGEGGMGVVYQAEDEARGRTVAVKALHNNLLGDMGIRRRFQREVNLMRTWIHPNVVQVYDVVDTEDLLAFVMEYVNGPSLQQHLEEWGGQMPYDTILPLFLDVLDAAQEAHQQGIVHRDLKPDNILLAHGQERMRPKIVDFGIAKVVEGTRYTMTGALLGTCKYMSPEQVSEPDLVDHRSDIYSLGVVLYQLISGRVPFDGDGHWSTMMAHVRKPPPPLDQFREGVPPALATLVYDALSKSALLRPQSCKDFATRLQDALGSTSPSGRSPRIVKELAPTIDESDGGTLVLVPEGTFKMGPDRRAVFLDAYYIDRYPVTNGQFARFLEITKYQPVDEEAQRFLAHWRQGRIPKEQKDHPIVFVSRTDALAYAKWAGKRLPTEAEWEKAARGQDGRRYPWGRDNPDKTRANYGNRHHGTLSVRAHPYGKSPYGVEDLAGNVSEWCQDVFDEDFYVRGPEHNPRNMVRVEDPEFVVRGGSWLFDDRSLRTYARTARPALYRASDVGFRCVRSV